jgi:hypothetical protein
MSGCFCNGTGWVCENHADQESSMCAECEVQGSHAHATPASDVPPGEYVLADLERRVLH